MIRLDQPALPFPMPPPVTMARAEFDLAHQIVRGFSEKHGYEPSDVLAENRHERFVWMRFTLMFLICEVCQCYNDECADVMQRHRTDVIHGVRRVIDRASFDKKFSASLRQWRQWAELQKHIHHDKPPSFSVDEITVSPLPKFVRPSSNIFA